jgi:hypothetical protein
MLCEQRNCHHIDMDNELADDTSLRNRGIATRPSFISVTLKVMFTFLNETQ